MSEEEVKQNLIDRYVDLLEIKAASKEENKVLERKILLIKIKNRLILDCDMVILADFNIVTRCYRISLETLKIRTFPTSAHRF